MEVKTLNIPLAVEDHEQLAAVKGDRTWQEAMLEEFGVREVTDDESDE